eukprot:CAMPEP_0170504214 /NCGR_PEP_ID=MMETSP0208-20121228/47239_1 /TAXON_ID=197538 /ORGANISM="Strombidium inclinatum, Strain S3" /LENGTH=106 /DNA_ID=CAMNT_0010784339 /DNA_START=693 /DNA_END=1013 /DNA_ORIENTATION=-
MREDHPIDERFNSIDQEVPPADCTLLMPPPQQLSPSSSNIRTLTQKVTGPYQTAKKKMPSSSLPQPSSLEDSVCLTEENRHINRVNPVALVDKDWTDDYKLGKLIK